MAAMSFRLLLVLLALAAAAPAPAPFAPGPRRRLFAEPSPSGGASRSGLDPAAPTTLRAALTAAAAHQVQEATIIELEAGTCPVEQPLEPPRRVSLVSSGTGAAVLGGGVGIAGWRVQADRPWLLAAPLPPTLRHDAECRSRPTRVHQLWVGGQRRGVARSPTMTMARHRRSGRPALTSDWVRHEIRSYCNMEVAASSLAHRDSAPAALKTDDYPGSVVYDKPAIAIPGVTNFSWSAMPLGNGNLSVSVWFEPPHDLSFYLGKSDSYDELHNLVKVGRVRVRFSGSPFPADGAGFRATLDLASATLHVAGAGGFAARLWVDANQPVLRIAASGLGRGATAQVASEIWRNNVTGRTPATATDLCWVDETLASVASDVVVPEPGAVAWYHRNGGTKGMLSHSSLWESELRLQGLGSLVDKPPPGMPPDPLTNATFGAAIIATIGAVAKHAPSDATMTVKATSAGTMELALVSIKLQTNTAAGFTTHLAEATRAAKVADSRAAYAQHKAWWSVYWNSSFVKVTAAAPSNATGNFNASLVTWQTAINRYLSACEGRGPGIIKFK